MIHINKIDDLVDKIIDDFFNKVILDKGFDKFFNETNFVKYQKEINTIFSSYEKNIDTPAIESIVNDNDNIETIYNLIKKYLGYYIFLTIGFFYKGKPETFINNIIEFSKNQPSFDFKINNFFNSESNANIIKYSDIIQKTILLLESEHSKFNLLKKKESFKESVEFLDNIGTELTNTMFKLENLDGDKKKQCHNIIKTIILNNFYFNNDKKDVIEILETAENEQGKYIFIDIIVPLKDYIDFSAVENVLSAQDVENGVANEIFDFIMKHEDIDKFKQLTYDDKILELINNNLLIPISEDFLLYHKDSEKYETTGFDSSNKKRDDTRIKYIINKIDTVAEYYSTNLKENDKKKIERMFYLPLSNRKAILINNNEELKIINKFNNQGKHSVENNEYYNDLINYRKYPYVNFKNFNNNGFSLSTNKTIDIIRNVSFQDNVNMPLQLRTGSENQNINIVGYVIPTEINNIHCVLNKNSFDIKHVGFKDSNHGIKKYDNGFDATIRLLKKKLFKKKPLKETVYWLFDLKKDSTQLDNYKQISKINNEQKLKLLSSQLYDNIFIMLYKQIRNIITNKKEISFYNFKKIIDYYQNKVFKFPINSKLYDELIKYAYLERYIRTYNVYDKKEDLFPGLYGNVIKLPQAPTKLHSKLPIISIKQITEKKQEEEQYSEIIKYNAICQHLISWEQMSMLQRKSPNEFNTLLFNFINQYVVENEQTDYVCKSCGTQINLKKYVLDGAYDDNNQYITFSTPMEIPLEDIPEYEQYKPTIRYLEKIIERVASVTNMTYFLGSVTATKWRKRGVIKDCIDILSIHNKNLQNIYQSRKEHISNLYGIKKDFTNLFVFNLENSIFVYSSKDKDQYKLIKQNNILIYILFLMILELNDSQLLFMGGDKICNYYFFEQIGLPLFNDLKINKNNKGDIVDIQNYKTLCYILYYVSCLLTKYNIWNTGSDVVKSKKFNPIVQKIIINTMVDLINSIIEFYSKNKKHYLYEIISVKFFKKLNSTFQDENILSKIKNINMKKIVTEDGKKKFSKLKIKALPLSDVYSHGIYQGPSNFKKCLNMTLYLNKKISKPISYDNINNITNCLSGQFHNWKPHDKTFKCSRCNIAINNNDLNTQNTIKARSNYRYIKLNEKAKTYCLSGKYHTFVYDKNSQKNICIKCNYDTTKSLSHSDLDKLEKNIISQTQNVNNRKSHHIDVNKTKQAKREMKHVEFINSIKNDYANTKTHKEDYFKFIELFINKLESIIGKNINIDNKNLYLLHDTYIIDHDHNGYKLPEPIILTDKDNKILHKKNHPFFKKDVIYYTNYKLGKIDIFYDEITLLLIGFKEMNKEFQYSKNKNIHLKLNYSIMNQLKYMGYNSKQIYVKDMINDLIDHFKNDEHLIVKNIVSNICRNRMVNLNKFMINVQKYLYRIKFDKDDYNKDNYILDSVIESTIDKFKKKLQKINLRDPKTKKKVFRYWHAIKYNLQFQNLNNKTINFDIKSDYYHADDISDYNYHGNLILYYIIKQFINLLDINNNKFIQSNIVYLIIDIIINAHNQFNHDERNINFNIKRFLRLINSKTYIHDVEEKGHGVDEQIDNIDDDTPDVIDYDEFLKKKDEIEEAEEEFNAIDVDTEIDYQIDYTDSNNGLDYEIDYAPSVNMNTNFSNDL